MMNNNKYILNDEGDPVIEPDLLKWARWFETATRTLKRDELPSGYTVSTVFLGLDHNFNPNGEPLLWETMVFAPAHMQEIFGKMKKVRRDVETDRYSNKLQANIGHEHMVQKWKILPKI